MVSYRDADIDQIYLVSYRDTNTVDAFLVHIISTKYAYRRNFIVI